MAPVAELGVPIEVLLVEDDPGDVLMTQEAFADYKVRNHLNVVTNGADALAYVRREGREVLADLKADPKLWQIPVVVLTTSSAEADILASYQLHANAYITKPV